MRKEVSREGEPDALSDPDTVLLAALGRGDEQAIAALFDRYSRLVYSIALRILRDASAAEDVMQEIFLRIWRDPTTFITTRGTLGGWLAVIARNRSIDVLRRRHPTGTLEDIQLKSQSDVYSEVEKYLLLERIRLVVAQLPPEQRSVLEMAFFDGCTHAEIAEHTGQPLGTIKTRVRSALQKLGRAFEA